MNIFKRLFKIGQAEIHALVEKMEDPIVLIEQGISDMREELSKAEESYVRTRAISIRTENKLRDKKEESDSLENKAKIALEKSKLGEITPIVAEKLALEALQAKKKILEECQELNTLLDSNTKLLEEISTHIEVLEFNISKWEKEVTTLKTKRHINAASALANRQMANIDSDSTIHMLERMKAKVADDEALAIALGERAKDKLTKDLHVGFDNHDSAKKELEDLKKQLGID